MKIRSIILISILGLLGWIYQYLSTPTTRINPHDNKDKAANLSTKLNKTTSANSVDTASTELWPDFLEAIRSTANYTPTLFSNLDPVARINDSNANQTGASQAYLHSSLSPLIAVAEDLGVADRNLPLNIAIALPLRNTASLDQYLSAVSDPNSSQFQQFLTQAEFNKRYAPSASQEQKLITWLNKAGLKVSQRFANHLFVVVSANHADIVRNLGISIHQFNYQNQIKYAAVEEPHFPAEIARIIGGVVGLDNFVSLQPKAVISAQQSSEPYLEDGTSCCHFGPEDVKTFYNANLGKLSDSPIDGSGESIIIAGAYAWKITDLNNFNQFWKLPQLTNHNSEQVCTGVLNSPGCEYNASQSLEVSLDAEYTHALASGAKIVNYMAADVNMLDFSILYQSIVLNNPGHIVTSSWGACEAQIAPAVQMLNDAIIANGNAIGQSWFAASGDNGADGCGNQTQSVDHPANSPHVISVGGTTPTCESGMNKDKPYCSNYGSESGWTGSGGGLSRLFKRPKFQTGCGIQQSAQNRLVPDVSLSADVQHYGYFVNYANKWLQVGGTSAATPQWAAYFALLNQYKSGNGKGLGLPGTQMYQLCETTAYHDIVQGNNGAYNSTPLYDNVTGMGSVNLENFLTSY